MDEKQGVAGNRFTLITTLASGTGSTKVSSPVWGRVALAAALVALSASCMLDNGGGTPPPRPDPNPRLALSPTSLDFGQVAVDVASTENVTLKNIGGTALLVSSAAITGEGFTMDETLLPVNLSPSETVLLKVTFTPSVLGTSTGNITFTSDATNSPTLLPLAGEAFQARTVGLAWDPSPSEVIGYYIYRSTSSGGPYTRVNLSIVAETSFLDNTAFTGTSYFYVVTAVSAGDVESVFSNEAAAPTP